MLIKFMVAALCLVLLTTGSIAGDKNAPEVVVVKEIQVSTSTSGGGEPLVISLSEISECNSGVCIVSLVELEAAGAKLAKLIAKLEANGDVSAKGAAKLNALIDELGEKLGEGKSGNVRVIGGKSPFAVTESLEAYVVNLSGKTDGEARTLALEVIGEYEDLAGVHSYKVIGEDAQIFVDGEVDQEFLTKIKEIQEVQGVQVLDLTSETDGKEITYTVKALADYAQFHSDSEISDEQLKKLKQLKVIHGDSAELEIEFEIIVDGEVIQLSTTHSDNKVHNSHGELGVILKELHEKHECEGDDCNHAEFIVQHQVHDNVLKEFHQKRKSSHGEGAHGNHGTLGHASSAQPRIMKHIAPPHRTAVYGPFGHGAELEKWFQEWDEIMEELAVDLSAVQLDLIQEQLDLARGYMDGMSGNNPHQTLSMMYSTDVEGMTPFLNHGNLSKFGGLAPNVDALEGLAMLFSKDGNIMLPDLLNGEEFEMMWIGEDGELSLDIEELKAEIEKLVQELQEKKLAE